MIFSCYISIIISTKNSPEEQVGQTLETLLNSNLGNIELIIVDQNKDQRIKKIYEEFLIKYNSAIIHYISSQETGLSKGRNCGFKKSSCEWILFLDDDAVIELKNWTNVYNILLQTKNTKCVYYGKVLQKEDHKNYLTRSAQTKKIHLINFDGVSSIALLFNRKVLEEVGLFDEMFGVGSEYGAGEESDLLLRILAKKIPILHLNNFIVLHPRIFYIDFQKNFNYGRGVGAVYRKHFFKSITFFIILFLKFCFEISIRFIFIMYGLLFKKNFYKKNWFYIKGLLSGFKTYETSRS